MARGLSIETITPSELTPEEIALWIGFVRADARYASPYFHPRFTQIAGEVAPGGRVAILEQNGEIVGFFPHQMRGTGAQPIGAPLNDYHDVIARRGAAPAIGRLAALMDATSLSVNGWTGAAGGAAVQSRQTLQADLSTGWAAYDAERRLAWGKFFKDKDRARRSLTRDHGDVEVTLGATAAGHLDRLVALKSAQYRQSGLHDIFACGWTVDLLKALLADNTPGFGASLAVLHTGGEAAAFEYGLHAGDRYHFWLPAYEARVARYSPGMLLSLETMRQASDQGFAVFDFGFAGEPYKKYFCNREMTVSEGVVHQDRPMDAMAAALSMAGAAAVAISPRLGQSLRRRWAAIDACETTFGGRVRGVAAAASVAVARVATPRIAINA